MATEMLVNELVKEILEYCQCSQYSAHFEGISKSTFRQLKLREIEARLPSTDEGRNAASKIHDELVRFLSLQNGVSPNNIPHGASNAATSEGEGVKSERDSGDDSSSESEDEPNLFQTERRPTVIEVSLDSDEDENEGILQESNDDRNTSTQSEVPEVESRRSSRYSLRQRNSANLNYDYDSDDDDEPRRKRRRDNVASADDDDSTEIVCVRNPLPLLRKLNREPDYIEQCSHVALCPENDYDDPHSCSLDDALEMDTKHWMEFYKKFGPSVYFLEMRIWSWKSLKSKCPFNLFKILKSFVPLVELSLKIGVVEGALDKTVRISPSQTLPSLKKIVISHSGRILYKNQLKSIIEAAANLEAFEYQYYDENDANDVLEMLEPVSSLKNISIRSYARDGFLKKEQLGRIKVLNLSQLEELELGNGLWEDIDGNLIDDLLKKTPNLKRMRVYGNYQGNSLHKPDVTINIPPLPQLEFLDIGGNYEFASVDESQLNVGGSSRNRIVTVDDDLKTDLFSATIKFPLFRNLKTLILGNLWKIDELHFSSFPKLECLRVGSPWHLAVKFPEKESRRFSYPVVTELQLPDCLKDPSFVQKIPERFPNLKKCWIFLPSVKVLRTFFRSMENSQLEQLFLKTQFDFEATMELCLLGRPSQAPRRYRDFMKHEELEQYGKFEEFVGFYNIELPPKKAEDIQELEDPSCAGLTALRSLKILHMEHVPRILRIPAGNLHWTHTNADFTDSFIGFKRYPLSRKCIEALPLQKLETCMWPNFDVYLRDTAGLQSAGFVDLGGNSSDVECDPDAPGTSRSSKRSARGEKMKVQIHPAMLQANIKFSQKEEKH